MMAIKEPSVARCIYHFIEAWAGQTPDAPAILAPGQPPLAYRALLSQVRETVASLNAMGIGRDDVVALVLPNGPEMAAAFLGIASGAIVAPLNPGYSLDEFGFYLSDLNAGALVIQAGMASPARDVAGRRGIPILELIPCRDAGAGSYQPGDSQTSRLGAGEFTRPDDVALLLHTSGTTARPKIVPLTHANLTVSARNIAASFALGSSDRCLNVMPLFHVHGLIGALLSSLAAGASVVCTSGFDAAGVFGWLEAFRPTWYTAVPTMHRAILDQAAAHRGIVDRCALRFIRSCSASLPPRLMTELERTFDVPVVESYGMTEASHQMTSNPLPPRPRKPGSVGIPTGPEVAIMDATGGLLPPGEAGEIVIRGTNVMPGYRSNPLANERAFLHGWFRTGDQGYLDDDGYLFITGRIKELINRGGEKVAPREVDEALLEHSAVAQAVTFAVPHPTLGEDVAAAVVLRGNAPVSASELRAFAFSVLAGHKVPSQVLIVDEIPKGPTGKLQRIGLAEKLASRLTAAYEPPSGPVEETLAGIWAEVLQIERVGARDNFFALGGDSLSAARVVSRLGGVFQLALPLEAMFRQPILADQALAIEELLLDAVEALSEEEARRLVGQM